METLVKKGFVEAYSIESYGDKGRKTHIKIFVDVNRELTETDNNNISNCANDLKVLLDAETFKTDPSCIQEAIEAKKEILNLFNGRSIFVEEIPNGYSDGAYFRNFPWFVVTTNLGRIKIGWRKSVINIDWSDSTIKIKADNFFPEEVTTKGDRNIHAWSYEKAQEYIDKILG